MAKKRGKSKAKTVSKKHTKEEKSTKKFAEKKSDSQKPVKEALHELEILAEEKKVEEKVNGIEKKEAAIITEEKKIEKETDKVEKLEKEIKKEVTQKPLEKFTIKDLNKGIIGAFIGVVAHYAFIYGKEIAKNISITRATVLVIFSYVIILVLIYETGYREIKEKRLLKVIPRRATAIYLTSIVVIILIFFMFNQLDLSNLSALYKEIAVTLVLASVGAGTADLIGKD